MKQIFRNGCLFLLSGVLLLSLVPIPAHATFPGENGYINGMMIFPAGGPACDIGELKTAGQRLFSSDLSGVEDLVLTDQPSRDVNERLTWSPDGGQFTFGTGSDFEFGIANYDGSSLVGPGGDYIVDPDATVENVSWLPDGITLVYGSYWGAVIQRIGDYNTRSISSTNELSNGIDFGFNNIVWSPKGTHFAYNRMPSYSTPEPARIGVSDINGNQTMFAGYRKDPDWSPDGTKLVFTSNPYGGTKNPLQVFTMNPDGTNIQQLTNDSNYRYEFPIWSPDGTKILVSRMTATVGYAQPSILMTLDAQTGATIDTYTPPCDAYFTSLGWQPLGPTKVYRMANWKTKERLFTTNKTEALFVPDDENGWILEGAAFNIPDENEPGVTPIYRLANWKTKERLFTSSPAERDHALTHYEGWVSEGTSFHASPTSGTGLVPIYRLANWKTKERLFTSSAHERDYAVAHYDGWVSEGVAFYVPSN